MSKSKKKSGRKYHAKRLVKPALLFLMWIQLIGLAGFLMFVQQQNPQPVANFYTGPTNHSVPSLKPDYNIPPVTNGLAPVVSNIPTNEKVVFLGIDDGAYKQPFELKLLRAKHIKASLFLADSFIEDNPDYFKGYIAAGSLIEDHTVDHAYLDELPYEQQRQEICNAADRYQQLYGRRPVLMRPPGGFYNEDTQRAAADCGMKAVVMWIAKANGGSMQYQYDNTGLHPGDIVLMHFRPEFKQDLQAFIDAQNAAGLHTELLENWLQ